MKNFLIISLLISSFFVPTEDNCKEWVKIARQTAPREPEFDGLYFSVPVDDVGIKAGRINFFLTKKDLADAWEKRNQCQCKKCHDFRKMYQR